MLVITRKEGEDIDITTVSGERIMIRVIRVKGKHVRIGVLAKRQVLIGRYIGGVRTEEDTIALTELMEEESVR